MEQANSEDPFTVAAMTGELIVDCKNVPLFAQCFYNNFEIGQFSVDLLDLWIKDCVLSFLNSSSARILEEEDILVGTNFCRNRFL